MNVPPLPPAPPTPALDNPTSIGYYAQVGYSYVVAVHMSVVPGTNLLLLMERPSGTHPDGNSEYIAGYYDLTTNRFNYINSTNSLFCCGHTIGADGNVVVVGGHRQQNNWDDGMSALRIFDRKLRKLTTVAQMRYPRWYPSVTLLPDGQVLIMGGTQGVGAGTKNNAMYEIWDPQNPQRETIEIAMAPGYLNDAKQVYYPYNYMMPSGDLFTFCSRFGRIIEPYTGTVKATLPRFTGSFNTQYPYTGTSVLLPLMPENKYAVDVVVFGGQDIKDSSAARPGLQASPWSQQLSVYDNGNGTYSFSKTWDIQYSGMPRVMGDATLLPNGKVVILNGAQYGQAGDNAKGGGSDAHHPAYHAYLFDPKKPSGLKYKQLARSQIARLYHSVAALTQDGTIAVSGCDRCWKFDSALDYSPSTTFGGGLTKSEYRMEIFYPPYYYSDIKPKIVKAPASIYYGEAFTVTYTAATTGANVNVTGAVLVAGSSTTHSFNTAQRVVGLVISSHNINTRTLTLVGPPNRNIAVPSVYLLFLLNGDYYSSGIWVTLAS